MKGYYKNKQWNYILTLEEYSKHIGSFEPKAASKKLGMQVQNININNHDLVNISAKRA